MQGNLQVYSCGGLGINIGKELITDDLVGRNELGFAKIDVAFIDTSMSNLKGVNPESTHVIEEVDGSGKVRSHNVEEISRQVRAILRKFEPKDINVVVSSGGGGSGSVFAPLIVSELLQQKKPVIVILVGSCNSIAELNNTISTIKSYESISSRTGQPIPLAYFQNSQEKTRSEINSTIRRAILMYAILFSRQNDELDSQDLQNFLYYNNIAKFPPRLVDIVVAENVEFCSAVGDIVTLVSINKQNDHSELNTLNIPEARFTGYVQSEVLQITPLKDSFPLHYAICHGGIAQTVKALQSKLSDYEAATRSAIVSDRVVSKTDAVHDSGLIL